MSSSCCAARFVLVLQMPALHCSKPVTAVGGMTDTVACRCCHRAALKAALGGGSSSDGTARRPAQRRSQSKNKFRASAFRR